MRRELQIQSSPAQSLLTKRGHRRFSQSWEKLMRYTLQVCNISTAQGAELSQASIRKPVYSICYVSSHVSLLMDGTS